MNYTRSDLIGICERSIVAEDQWLNRDTAKAQIGVGTVWALLKAGCDFHICYDKAQALHLEQIGRAA